MHRNHGSQTLLGYVATNVGQHCYRCDHYVVCSIRAAISTTAGLLVISEFIMTRKVHLF